MIMQRFGAAHLLLFAATAAFIALSMWAISKISRKWQNLAFICAAALVSGCIFYRFAMGLSPEGDVHLKPLLLELLQVCNFNFLLVWLMLIPKFELARQYAIYFSMFAASTTLFNPPNRWNGLAWNDPTVINSWIYHAGVVMLTLWMLSARRLKPRRDYIWKVTACVFIYFTAVAIITPQLIKHGIIPPTESYSYVFDTEGIGAFDFFYRLVPRPYFYLYPVVPFMLAFFFGLAWLFRRYEVKAYREKNLEK